MKRVIASFMVAGCALAANAVVFPTNAHAAFNFIPFGNNQSATMHQVFRANLFGATPVIISNIGFAVNVAGNYTLDMTLNLGYTNRIPGVASGAGGLSIPTAGGGGTPNALGAMSTFFSNPAYNFTVNSPGNANFSEMNVGGNFVYDPSLGNLLVEIVSVAGVNAADLAVSRAAGSAESSRAYASTRFTSAESPTTATRMDFTFVPVPEPASMIALGAGVAALLARRRRK